MNTPSVNLDQLILTHVTHNWQKVAMVLAKALRARENMGSPISAEELAARVEALVRNGKLEVRGNVQRWRESEIRIIGDQS